MLIDFDQLIAEGKLRCDAADVGDSPAVRPSGQSILIHPNVASNASVYFQAELSAGPSFLNIKIENPHPSANSVAFKIVAKQQYEVVAETMIDLLGANAANIRLNFQAENGVIEIELSTRMSMRGAAIDRAWATFSELRIGSCYQDFFASIENLALIEARELCFLAGQWREVIEPKGFRTFFEAATYRMTAYRGLNTELLRPIASETLEIYANNKKQDTVAATVYCSDEVIHVDAGVLLSSRGFVRQSVKFMPPNIFQEAIVGREIGDGSAVERLHCGMPIFIMAHYGGSNYGHWLIEMYPRLISVLSLVREGRMKIAISTPQSNNATVLQCLEVAGVPRESIIVLPRTPIVIEKAVFTSPISRHMHPGWMSPSIPAALDVLTQSIAPASHSGKLFVSRQDAACRHLKNEDEVFARLEPLGYQRILAGNLSFRDQVAMFRGATEVVGIFGAAMTNTIFMPKGGRVCTLAPNHFADHFYWNIASLRGLDYREAIGPVEAGETSDLNTRTNFEIDADQLARFLTEVAAERAIHAV